MADFDVIYQDITDPLQPSTSGAARAGTSLRSSARRDLGGSGDSSISGSGMHSMHRRDSGNNAIVGTVSSGGDGVATIEEDEGSAMVAIVQGDSVPDASTFATLITPDPIVIRGAGNITV